MPEDDKRTFKFTVTYGMPSGKTRLLAKVSRKKARRWRVVGFQELLQNLVYRDLCGRGKVPGERPL